MYRNTAQIAGSNVATTTLLSPPLDKQRDRTDPDVSYVLAERRRQIDHEIAEFKILKEKEFHDFEKDLLKQRQRRRRDAKKIKNDSSKDKAPNALSLLGVLNQSNAHANGSLARRKKSPEEEVSVQRPLAPASKPTLSLDRLNIRGETTPPLMVEGSSPSPSSCLMRQFSRSPPNQSLSLTPPRARSGKQERAQPGPPTPANDHTSDTFAGIFSPSYLPLLESRENTQGRKPKAVRSESFSDPRSSSASISISPVARKDRSLTAPLLPSNSLPSALRTASGTAMRKQKRVTFQLADSAIVEPSSSYEEGPSPMREDELNFDEKIDGVMTDGNDGAEESDYDAESGLAKRMIRSPTIVPSERKSSADEEKSSPRSALEVSVNGDMGTGFFELDEELASPGFNTHDKKFIDDDMEDVEKSSELRRNDDDVFDVRKKPVYEYGGSVPIDIARPTGSWLGSFGH